MATQASLISGLLIRFFLWRINYLNTLTIKFKFISNLLSFNNDGNGIRFNFNYNRHILNNVWTWLGFKRALRLWKYI